MSDVETFKVKKGQSLKLKEAKRRLVPPQKSCYRDVVEEFLSKNVKVAKVEAEYPFLCYTSIAYFIRKNYSTKLKVHFRRNEVWLERLEK
jgi:hypothetical protein